jgi:RNA polymerase sigma-70 factor (ECF subfamily)
LETITETKQGREPTAWLDDHGDYLYRYALMRVRDGMMAEDLVQETLLAAVGSYQGNAGRSSERTWLVGIMKRQLIDHFRRLASTAAFQLTPGGDDDETDWIETSGPWRGHWREDKAPLSWFGDAATLLESPEFWEIFERCLSQLPQQMSIVFTLRELDGLSATEICEILNLTPETLLELLNRSRTKLRRLLEANWFSRRAAAA